MHSAPSPAAHRCACGGPPFIGRSGWLRVILQFMFNFAGNSSHLSLFAARAIRVRMTVRSADPSSQSQSVPSPVGGLRFVTVVGPAPPGPGPRSPLRRFSAARPRLSVRLRRYRRSKEA